MPESTQGRPSPAGQPASSHEGAGRDQRARGGPPAEAGTEDEASGHAPVVDPTVLASEYEKESYFDDDADAD
eukprot:5422482-Pyramimonas_sp.AAC.1